VHFYTSHFFFIDLIIIYIISRR